ncbi:hypothetical protein ACJX0J_042209, partial [Zea mays]
IGIRAVRAGLSQPWTAPFPPSDSLLALAMDHRAERRRPLERALHCPGVSPVVPAPSFSRREQQPQRLRCFVLRSEQHTVDARRVFAIFAQPHPRRLSSP